MTITAKDKLVDAEAAYELSCLTEMAWTKPDYSKTAIDKAGQVLINADASLTEMNHAYTVINNFRSSHSFPLNVFQNTLRDKAYSVDKQRLIAQRLKRIVSIRGKLQKEDWMRLSQMQDIGGCRAIVQTVKQVEKLRDIYEENKKRSLRHDLKGVDDYMNDPKESGYRGVHLKYRYQSDKVHTYDGLRLEIQLRSKLQHAWATAVETAGTFMGQALKSSVGNADWLRFFALMGTAHAVMEQYPPVPNTPNDEAKLKNELKKYLASLRVVTCLEGYNYGLEIQTEKAQKAHYFLLRLDAPNRRLRFRQYKRKQLLQAQEDYLKMERQDVDTPGIHVVLVSVDSMKNLRRAYPNYRLDTAAFIASIEDFCENRY